jgi:hypothetical protein
MANMSAAEGRRGRVVRNLRLRLETVQREIDRGVNGAYGQLDPYLSSRMPLLREEADRISGEIDELEALEGDELNRRFVPEAFPPEDAPEPEDDMSALERLFPKRGQRPYASPVIVRDSRELNYRPVETGARG